MLGSVSLFLLFSVNCGEIAMEQMQCPSGEHCLRKERGDTCLMWHPPAVSNLENTETGNTSSEEERLLQLAIKKSLQPQMIYCQFCGREVDSRDDLQLHQMKCEVIDAGTESAEIQVKDDNSEEENTNRRKSSRKRRKTEKYAAYSQSLTEYDEDSE